MKTTPHGTGPQAPDDASPLMTPDQAATFLGISERTLGADRSRNSLGVPFVKLSGKVVRYRRSDLVAWVAGKVKRPGGAPADDAGAASDPADADRAENHGTAG